jgi:hypothetical protein
MESQLEGLAATKKHPCLSHAFEISPMHLISPPTQKKKKKTNKILFSNMFVIIYFKMFLNSYNLDLKKKLL